MATLCTSKGLMSLFQEPAAAPLPLVLPFSRAGSCVLVPVLLLRPPAWAQVLSGWRRWDSTIPDDRSNLSFRSVWGSIKIALSKS